MVIVHCFCSFYKGVYFVLTKSHFFPKDLPNTDLWQLRGLSAALQFFSFSEIRTTPAPMGNDMICSLVIQHSYWKYHISIVDLPIKDGSFPWFSHFTRGLVFTHVKMNQTISSISWTEKKDSTRVWRFILVRVFSPFFRAHLEQIMLSRMHPILDLWYVVLVNIHH